MTRRERRHAARKATIRKQMVIDIILGALCGGVILAILAWTDVTLPW